MKLRGKEDESPTTHAAALKTIGSAAGTPCFIRHGKSLVKPGLPKFASFDPQSLQWFQWHTISTSRNGGLREKRGRCTLGQERALSCSSVLQQSFSTSPIIDGSFGLEYDCK